MNRSTGYASDFSWLTRRVGGKWEAELIARVHIAPVEQWCPQNLKDLEDFPLGAKLVGMEVEILTETMQQIGDCVVRDKVGDGKVWRVTAKSREAIGQILYPTKVDEDLMLCEHMLEMD